jgi:hypothetical protein
LIQRVKQSNIQTLMAYQHPEIPITSTSKFTVHGDDAPTFYLTNNPGQNDPATRAFERAASTLTAVNPYTATTSPARFRSCWLMPKPAATRPTSSRQSN